MTDNKRPWSPPQMIWSALIATVVWSAIGFNWFGSGFNWTTQGDAKRMTADVVKENQALICVAQASMGYNSAALLEQFAELEQWKQSDFVETERWAVMPGSESPGNGVAALCAKKLRQT